jgi:hypothetical protein
MSDAMDVVRATAMMSVLVLLAACGRSANDGRGDANDTGGGQKVNATTPLAAPVQNSPAGDANADNPATGLNNQRPDSPKDLQPAPPVR